MSILRWLLAMVDYVNMVMFWATKNYPSILTFLTWKCLLDTWIYSKLIIFIQMTSSWLLTVVDHGLQYQPLSSENALYVMPMNYFILAFSFFSRNGIRIIYVNWLHLLLAMVDHVNMVIFCTTKSTLPSNIIFSDLKMCRILEFIVSFKYMWVLDFWMCHEDTNEFIVMF